MLDMTGQDVTNARHKLGELWNLGRALTPIELARALGLKSNDNIINIEAGRTALKPTLAILISLYMRGAVPPDEVEIFRARGRRRADPNTGLPPEPRPSVPRRRK